MSIASRLSLGFGAGALAVASLGFIATTPVENIVVPPGFHGGGGASNGQPVTIDTSDWRSIDDLFKKDKSKTKAALRARILEDDEAAIACIMQAVIEELI